MRLGLFIPCYIEAFFPEVGIATLSSWSGLATTSSDRARPDDRL
jgi:hypothetical protein